MNKRLFFLLFFYLFLFVAGAGTASAALNDADLSYAYDTGSGSTAIDDSINNNDGTVNGATWLSSANAKLGNSALSFDGNDYVATGVIVSDFPFTVVSWIKIDNEDVLMRFWGQGESTSNFIFLGYEGRSSGDKGTFQLGYRTSGTDFSYISDTTFTNYNDYYHVVAVYNSASDFDLYIDGNEVSMSSSGTSSSFPSTDKGSFGAIPRTNYDFGMHGYLDQSGIYSYAWTQEDVLASYNNGNGCDPYVTPCGDTSQNFTISARDSFDNSSLSNFSATLQNSDGTLSFSTTNGTINTGIMDNSTSLYNITVSSDEAGGYFSEYFENYNLTSNPLVADLSQFRGTAYNQYNNNSISSFTITYDSTNFSTTNGLLRTNFGDASRSSEPYTVSLSSSEDGGYFTKSGLLISNASAPFNTSLVQASLTFFADDRVSGDQLSVANYSVFTSSNDGFASGVSSLSGFPSPLFIPPTLGLASGNDFLFTWSLDGWYNQVLSGINVSALETSSYRFEVFNHQLNVTVRVGSGSAPESNFTIDLVSLNHSYSETLSTTDGSVLFNLTHGTYNLTLNDSLHELQTQTLVLNSTQNFTSFEFNARTARSFNISFFNETSNELIDDKNITVEFISDLSAFNTSTSDGNVFVELLTPGEYRIKYYIDESNPRNYYTTLSEQSFQEIDLYLIDEEISAFYVPRAVNELGNACQGNTVSLLRYYIEGNAYKTVEMARTDSQGQAVLRVRPNVVDYKLLFTGSCGTYTTPPERFIDTTRTYTILSAQSPLQGVEAIRGASTSLTYNNATETFVYSWTSDSNLITQGCLEVTRRSTGIRETIGDVCGAGNTGSVFFTLPPNSTEIGNTFFATGRLYTSTQFSIYDTDQEELRFTAGFFELGGVAPFVSLIFFIAFTLLIGVSAASLIIGTILSIGILSLFTFISLSWGVLSTIIILGVLLLYRLGTS